MANGTPKRSLPWGQIALGVSVVVMIELLLLLAVGSNIKRSNEKDSVARARISYVNAMTVCADTNDRITESNKRTQDVRRLRSIVKDFAGQARDARLASGDDNVAANYENERAKAEGLRFAYADHINCVTRVRIPKGAKFGDLPSEVRRRVLYLTSDSPPIPVPLPPAPKEVP